MLALSLAAAVVLALSQRALLFSGHGSVWMASCWIGSGLALLAVVRRALPSAPSRLSAPIWWVAGILGAAVLSRHVLDSLSIAAAEMPATMPVVGPFDLGDLVLWGVLLLAITASAGLRSGGRPGLRLGIALIALALPALLLVGMNFDLSRMRTSLLEPNWDGAPGKTAAALSWVLALVTCSKERAARRLGMATWLPPLVGCAVLVLLPFWLLATHGGAGLARVDGSFLLLPGARVFGMYGGRVGAGIEAAITLGGLVGLLAFSARWSLASRLLGSLESVVAVSCCALAAALVPLPHLIMLAALVGWIAVIMGLPPRQQAR